MGVEHRIRPTFLIVGAMKAGTTTLYRDLAGQPGIEMSVPKEPQVLARDVSREEALEEYGQVFGGTGRLLGEASTEYSKLPAVVGVPERAKRVCGADIKIIYMVRDPLDRIRSQYQHEWLRGVTDGPAREVVRPESRFVYWSLYWRQICEWLRAFDREQVLVVEFEEYMKNRVDEVERIGGFLGFEADVSAVRVGENYNPSDGRSQPRGLWDSVRKSWLYKRGVRPHLSLEARRRLRQVMPARTPERMELPEDVWEEIRQQLWEDNRRLIDEFGVGRSWKSFAGRGCSS